MITLRGDRKPPSDVVFCDASFESTLEDGDDLKAGRRAPSASARGGRRKDCRPWATNSWAATRHSRPQLAKKMGRHETPRTYTYSGGGGGLVV